MSTATTSTNARPRVLVAEKIGESGIELLQRHFDVELGMDWSREELIARIGSFDGILIRSATKLTPDLIERAGDIGARALEMLSFAPALSGARSGSSAFHP